MMLYRRGGVGLGLGLGLTISGNPILSYILFLLLHRLYLESTDYSESQLFGHSLYYILLPSLLQEKNNLSATSSRVWTERCMRIFPSETEGYLEPYFNGAHFRAYGMELSIILEISTGMNRI